MVDSVPFLRDYAERRLVALLSFLARSLPASDNNGRQPVAVLWTRISQVIFLLSPLAEHGFEPHAARTAALTAMRRALGPLPAAPVPTYLQPQQQQQLLHQRHSNTSTAFSVAVPLESQPSVR